MQHELVPKTIEKEELTDAQVVVGVLQSLGRKAEACSEHHISLAYSLERNMLKGIEIKESVLLAEGRNSVLTLIKHAQPNDILHTALELWKACKVIERDSLKQAMEEWASLLALAASVREWEITQEAISRGAHVYSSVDYLFDQAHRHNQFRNAAIATINTIGVKVAAEKLDMEVPEVEALLLREQWDWSTIIHVDDALQISVNKAAEREAEQ